MQIVGPEGQARLWRQPAVQLPGSSAGRCSLRGLQRTVVRSVTSTGVGSALCATPGCRQQQQNASPPVAVSDGSVNTV